MCFGKLESVWKIQKVLMQYIFVLVALRLELAKAIAGFGYGLDWLVRVYLNGMTVTYHKCHEGR